MKCHPFDELIVSDQIYSDQEAEGLAAHLQQCKSCQELASAWENIESELYTQESVSPEPGFSTRWLVRLRTSQREIERRQSLVLLAFTIFSAFLIFASLAVLSLPLILEPKLLILTWIHRIGNLITYFQTINIFSVRLFRATMTTIPALGWIFVLGLLCELIVLWLVTFRLALQPRRIIR